MLYQHIILIKSNSNNVNLFQSLRSFIFQTLLNCYSLIQQFRGCTQISPWGTDDTNEHFQKFLSKKHSTSLTSVGKILSKTIEIPNSNKTLNPVIFRSKLRQLDPSCESKTSFGKFKKRNSLGSLNEKTQPFIQEKSCEKSIAVVKRSRKQIEAMIVYRLRKKHQSIQISYGKNKSTCQIGLSKQKKTKKLKFKQMLFQNPNVGEQKQKRNVIKNSTLLNLPKIDFSCLFAH